MNIGLQRGILRDVWGRPGAAQVDNQAWLTGRSDCFRPKLAAAPLEGAAIIPPNGFQITALSFVPGSWITGFSLVGDSGVEFQVTDLATAYKLFSGPCPGFLLTNQGAYFAPWLIEPYQLAGSAALRLEIWNPQAIPAIVQIVVHSLQPFYEGAPNV